MTARRPIAAQTRPLSEEEKQRIMRDYGVANVPATATVVPKHTINEDAYRPIGPRDPRSRALAAKSRRMAAIKQRSPITARPAPPPDIPKHAPPPLRPAPKQAPPPVHKPPAPPRPVQSARAAPPPSPERPASMPTAPVDDAELDALVEAAAEHWSKHPPEPVAEPAAQDSVQPQKSRRPKGDKLAAKRDLAATKAREKVRDRRRFKSTPVPTGETFRALDRDHPAAVEGRTTHPHTLRDPATDMDEPVLKDGALNAKIGGDVLVGRLKGAKILTLTLEERATCPRSCAHWLTCYGAGMQYARRWRHGPALYPRIKQELRDHCASGRPVLVRLHVLGDFWSVEYVDMWRLWLERHPNLHTFGFTAWGPETDIGRAIADTSDAFLGRFMIRHSGRGGRWGSFTINFPTQRRRIGDAVVCPEQQDAMTGDPRKRHCGSCALCWQCDVPIVFVEH